MSYRILNELIPVPHGHLESVWFMPDKPEKIIIALHPHPLHGGTMHNKATYTLADAGREAGYMAIRFNFRGVGKSSGSYGDTIGEAQDLADVIDFLNQTVGPLPMVLAGFSFGARTLLRFLETSTFQPEKLIFSGLPVAFFQLEPTTIAQPAPTLFIQGGLDEFSTPMQTVDFIQRSGWTTAIFKSIDDCDHFYNRHIHTYRREVLNFLQPTTGS